MEASALAAYTAKWSWGISFAREMSIALCSYSATQLLHTNVGMEKMKLCEFDPIVKKTLKLIIW